MSDTSFGIVNEAFDSTETPNTTNNTVIAKGLSKHDDFDEKDKYSDCYIENRNIIIRDKDHHEESIANKTKEDGGNDEEMIEKDHTTAEKYVKADAVLDFIYKLRGPAFRSMREKKLKRIWRRASLKEEDDEAEM